MQGPKVRNVANAPLEVHGFPIKSHAFPWLQPAEVQAESLATTTGRHCVERRSPGAG